MLFATATGNLGRDAELKKVGDSSVCEFSMAVKTSFKRDAQPTWIKCAIWGQRGANLAEMLTKGTKVTVVGPMTFREYQTKQGEARVSYEIEVRDLDFSGGGNAGGGGAGGDRAAAVSNSEPDDSIPF